MNYINDYDVKIITSTNYYAFKMTIEQFVDPYIVHLKLSPKFYHKGISYTYNVIKPSRHIVLMQL